MFQILFHAAEHAVTDSVKLLPFLLLTYLLMEYIEHEAEGKTTEILHKVGKAGPAAGGILGIIPQCGIAAAASNLYAARLISAGTLLAVYWSASDEMLPMLLSGAVEAGMIIQILLCKAGIAMTAGFGVDMAIRIFGKKEAEEWKIHELCEQEHCNCEDGVLKSALRHTIRIFCHVLLITFLLNLGIEIIGEEALADFILNRPVLGPVLAGIIGLIPNCAASVIITRMFLDGLMSFGTLLAGSLVGAGIGVLVLFRVNEDRRESLKLTGVLYAVGVTAGILINIFL